MLQTKGIVSRTPFGPNNSSAKEVELHIFVMLVLRLPDYFWIKLWFTHSRRSHPDTTKDNLSDTPLGSNRRFTEYISVLIRDCNSFLNFTKNGLHIYVQFIALQKNMLSYCIRISGIFTQLAAATAAKGTKRPIIGDID